MDGATTVPDDGAKVGGCVIEKIARRDFGDLLDPKFLADHDYIIPCETLEKLVMYFKGEKIYLAIHDTCDWSNEKTWNPPARTQSGRPIARAAKYDGATSVAASKWSSTAATNEGVAPKKKKREPENNADQFIGFLRCGQFNNKENTVIYTVRAKEGERALVNEVEEAYNEFQRSKHRRVERIHKADLMVHMAKAFDDPVLKLVQGRSCWICTECKAEVHETGNHSNCGADCQTQCPPGVYKESHPNRGSFYVPRDKAKSTVWRTTKTLGASRYITNLSISVKPADPSEKSKAPRNMYWYKCTYCDKDVEYDAGNGYCCDEYINDERPKTHSIASKAKAKKMRVRTVGGEPNARPASLRAAAAAGDKKRKTAQAREDEDIASDRAFWAEKNNPRTKKQCSSAAAARAQKQPVAPETAAAPPASKTQPSTVATAPPKPTLNDTKEPAAGNKQGRRWAEAGDDGPARKKDKSVMHLPPGSWIPAPRSVTLAHTWTSRDDIPSAKQREIEQLYAKTTGNVCGEPEPFERILHPDTEIIAYSENDDGKIVQYMCIEKINVTDRGAADIAYLISDVHEVGGNHADVHIDDLIANILARCASGHIKVSRIVKYIEPSMDVQPYLRNGFASYPDFDVDGYDVPPGCRGRLVRRVQRTRGQRAPINVLGTIGTVRANLRAAQEENKRLTDIYKKCIDAKSAGFQKELEVERTANSALTKKLQDAKTKNKQLASELSAANAKLARADKNTSFATAIDKQNATVKKLQAELDNANKEKRALAVREQDYARMRRDYERWRTKDQEYEDMRSECEKWRDRATAVEDFLYNEDTPCRMFHQNVNRGPRNAHRYMRPGERLEWNSKSAQWEILDRDGQPVRSMFRVSWEEVRDYAKSHRN